MLLVSDFIENILKVTIPLKDSKLLSLRQAALQAMDVCFHCWYDQFSQANNTNSESMTVNQSHALHDLLNISQLGSQQKEDMDMTLLSVVSATLDWITVKYKDEADELCRLAMQDILRVGLKVVDHQHERP